jgi:hypothetical protein
MRYAYLVLAVVLAIVILLLRAHVSAEPPPTGAPPALSAEQKQAVRTLLEYGGVLLHRNDRLPGHPIVLVDFTNHPEFRNEWLKTLTAFPELQNVGLAGTALTDAGLDYVQRIPKLQTLTLNDTPVTDLGLTKLSACTQLRTLDVRGTHVSTAGLAALQNALPRLQIISDSGNAAIDKSATSAGTKASPPVVSETPAQSKHPHARGTPTSGDVARFTAAEIAKLRGRVAEIAMVPESTPEGWSKSKLDPTKLLTVFSALRLREGFTFRAYQFKDEGNGNGFVWAMPVDAEFPAPADCPRLESHFLKAPKPYEALDDAMEAIEGNDTAEAYLQASLLRRELKDFGALWHGVLWGTHHVVDDDPLKGAGAENADPMRTPMSKPEDWKWLEPRPTDWQPRVVLEPDRAVVTFYTYSGFEKEKLFRHIDVYRRGKYRPRVEEAVVAEGPAGYRF